MPLLTSAPFTHSISATALTLVIIRCDLQRKRLVRQTKTPQAEGVGEERRVHGRWPSLGRVIRKETGDGDEQEAHLSHSSYLCPAQEPHQGLLDILAPFLAPPSLSAYSLSLLSSLAREQLKDLEVLKSR